MADFAEAEQAARFYQQELSIAAAIQQQLMNPTIPDVEFATVRAKSMACNDIGGDFFDVVFANRQSWVVVADVSGKGIPAALVSFYSSRLDSRPDHGRTFSGAGCEDG